MLSKREQAKIRRRDEAALAKDEDVDWTPQLEREQENRSRDEGREMGACMHKYLDNLNFVFLLSIYFLVHVFTLILHSVFTHLYFFILAVAYLLFITVIFIRMFMYCHLL